MFSYRHGFHAGNHADVLKHVIMAQVLAYFRLKETPFWAIDTHAGAGLYDLSGAWANKRAEYLDGVARVWSHWHPAAGQDQIAIPKPVRHALLPWIKALEQLNPDHQLRFYPGSPWLWLDGWREQDKLKLIEQLPAEAEVLRKNLSQRHELPPRAVQVLERDGFDALKAFMPPPVRRAFVMMDPSYEDKRDYQRVVDSVKDALTRFPSACIMVWYPRVSRLQVEQMRKQLRRLAPAQWLDVDMTISRPPADGHGLFGSGCFVINPPYTLAQTIRPAMPWLTEVMALDNTARWNLEAGENKPQATDEDAPVRPTAERRSNRPGQLPPSRFGSHQKAGQATKFAPANASNPGLKARPKRKPSNHKP